MPELNEIVDVTISIQSSAISQASFDSILINGRGGTTNDQNFNAGFAEHEVRQYTSFAAVGADSDIKPNANVTLLAQKVFAQTPAVGTVFISRSNDGTPAPQVSTLLYTAIPLITGQDVSVFIEGVDSSFFRLLNFTTFFVHLTTLHTHVIFVVTRSHVSSSS